MTRPGFALSVLLVTLTGSLLAVRTANSQQLDGRLGGVKYGLCPLIGDELYDCGFGAHTCDIASLSSDTPRIYRSRTVPHWSLSACSLSEWCGPHRSAEPRPATPAKTTADPYTQYLSGYDETYDLAVYGQSVIPPFTNDWAGWDWGNNNEHRAVAVHPAPAVTAAAKRPMEVEPESIEQYYSMYGGEPPAATTFDLYDDNYGYAPASIDDSQLVDLVLNWSSQISLQRQWDSVKGEYLSMRDRLVHELMISKYWPSYAEVHRAFLAQWTVSQQVSVPTTVGADKACCKVAVVRVARSLDQAGRMLQNASRRLMQLVENPAAEISAASDYPDQR